MRKVEDLRAGWEHEQASAKATTEKKGKKTKVAPDAIDDGLFPDEDDAQQPPPSSANLFDSDSDNEMPQPEDKPATDEAANEASTSNARQPEEGASRTSQH